MKAGKRSRKGFVLILVIVILTLVEMCMIVLACNANTFIFQADRDYLEACRQNLIASGLSWAKKNVDARKTTTGVIELDTADMNIKTATLGVAVSEKHKETAQVEITTSCSRGRQTITSSKKFAVSTHTASP